MRKKFFLEILTVAIIAASVQAQQFKRDRVCSSSHHTDECNQLQRGNTEVVCVYAQDAIECAKRILNGTAEFGAFSGESAYLIASMGWSDLTVVKEIRHKSRWLQKFDFQSVVVVRSDHTNGGNLRLMDFCHPGLDYDQHLKWSENFLKHFERTVVPSNCSYDGTSPVEVEVAAMDGFFNAACRPGTWSVNPNEDKELKAKYPRLCSLCDDPATCSYESPSEVSSHKQALQCMKKSTNAVTYVALQEAQDFFNADENSESASQFSYLCTNGTLQPVVGNESPCVWLSQPWNVIVSTNLKAISLATQIETWTNNPIPQPWEDALKKILMPSQYRASKVSNIVPLPDYIAAIRPVPIDREICPSIRWCTHSPEEKEKCDILRMAAMTKGVRPFIKCNHPNFFTVTCISDVSSGKADFVGIDSNLGYLARHPYNLTAALFQETEIQKYSSVVAVIKESDVDRIKSFEDFKDKKACFGEFGGIASIAFINIAKSRGIFKQEECEFGSLLGNYFGDSCFPGSRDDGHNPSKANLESMCALCQTRLAATTTARPMPMAAADDGNSETEATVEGQDDADAVLQSVPVVPDRSINCEAEATNRFYGTRGALSCLNEIGEVAVVELQNLASHAETLKLNPDDFRIICRNGSLAANPGFDVDPACVLTTIVDGEVVVRRNSSKTSSVVNVLLSLDKYIEGEFKMYNIFNGERDLLFEDSSLGLVSPSDVGASESVHNYIKLFEDIENCIKATDGSSRGVAVNVLLTLSLVLFTIFIRN